MIKQHKNKKTMIILFSEIFNFNISSWRAQHIFLREISWYINMSLKWFLLKLMRAVIIDQTLISFLFFLLIIFYKAKKNFPQQLCRSFWSWDMQLRRVRVKHEKCVVVIYLGALSCREWCQEVNIFSIYLPN